MPEPGWHQAVPLADLLPGLTEVRVGVASILLVRQGDGVHATASLCPHKFTPLADGTAEDGKLTCMQHGACFDLATGSPPPGQDWAGRLQVYPVRVREGMVEVQLPALE